jgi:MFS family permease
MSPPRWPVVWILGAGQCVYWGIVYYAFSVLLVPMRDEWGASDAAVAGAFSVGLTVSAVLATAVGRWLDRGHGVLVLRAGAWAGAALLLAWSYVDGLAGLYAVWAGLGACMALVLYETAFALITRAFADPSARLRALASLTVMGGLASTVFLPLVGAGVAHLGWRLTLRVLAVVWLLATLWLERAALRELHAAESWSRAAAPATNLAPVDRRLLWWTGAPFVAATFSAMALTTLVVPSLVARGHPIERTAWVLAALGIMQLPGRVWLWRGAGRALSPRVLLVGPLALQVAGLALLGLAGSLAGAFLGVAVFGVGAGLHTLARPWIVPLMFGAEAAGRTNGVIARAQGLARAAGPFAVAAAAGWLGSDAVLLVLASTLLACCPLAYALSRHPTLLPHPAA